MTMMSAGLVLPSPEPLGRLPVWIRELHPSQSKINFSVPVTPGIFITLRLKHSERRKTFSMHHEIAEYGLFVLTCIYTSTPRSGLFLIVTQSLPKAMNFCGCTRHGFQEVRVQEVTCFHAHR